MIDRIKRAEELMAFDYPYKKNGSVVAGMDEVGRGPLAGNVVTACVVMPDEPVIPWIDDSKKLSESRREKLYDEIISVCAKTTEFCGENIFESDDEAEIARYRKLRDAVENLHDVAHELEEHLAWD